MKCKMKKIIFCWIINSFKCFVNILLYQSVWGEGRGRYEKITGLHGRGVINCSVKGWWDRCIAPYHACWQSCSCSWASLRYFICIPKDIWYYLILHYTILYYLILSDTIWYFLILSQPQPQHNVTQPQHSCWVGHENDFANPTPPQKLNSSLSEPQNNIHWLQLNIVWSATTSRATTTTTSTTNLSVLGASD